jgi:hypothetical protein
MTTSEPASNGGEDVNGHQLMSSAVGSRANPSAKPAGGSCRTTPGGYGLQWHPSFAHFDPGTSQWRTSQISLLEEWGTFSATWPRAGMTRNGIAFRLRQLVPRIAGNGSSSWPTPTARLGDSQRQPSQELASRRYFDQKRRDLDDAVAIWPTPTANDWKGAGYQNDRGAERPTLTGAARSSIGGGPKRASSGYLNPAWVEWLMGFPPGWTDLEP